MHLKQLYQKYLATLTKLYSAGEASAICNIVFNDVAGLDKKFIITHPEFIIEPLLTDKLNKALDQLEAFMPVQYVLEETQFLNLKFKVSPAVLIPRPETEELVNAAIDFIQSREKKSVVDIGTGSGCIPVSIKVNCPETSVVAIDYSEDALNLAKENGLIHHADIDWRQFDFLDEEKWLDLEKFDVIISNPPYIPAAEKTLLDKNVIAYEPEMALFVPDEDPLVFYKKIALFGKQYLQPDGKIFMEVHEKYAQDVADYFTQSGYETAIIKDFHEKERMVTAIPGQSQ